MVMQDKAMAEIEDVLQEMEALLKNPDVGATLTERGINTSLALLVVDGLRAYLAGEKERAAEDFGTFAEEVHERLRVHEDKVAKPS